MITTNTLPANSGKVRLITLWILSGLVALAFLGAGGAKLAGAAALVELFDKVGRGQWFRYFTGLLEVAGGIGLLIRRRFEPGVEIVIEPLTKQENFQPLVVRVIRAIKQSGGSLLGCEFASELTGGSEELAQLLRDLGGSDASNQSEAP